VLSDKGATHTPPEHSIQHPGGGADNNDVHEQEPRHDQPKTPEPPCKTDWGPFVYAYLALSLVIASGVYSWAMVVTTGPLASIVPASESRSVAILIILTTFAGILLNELCSVTFDIIAWTRVQSPKGISVASFLSISPTTGFEGLIRLLTWRTGSINHHWWVFIR